jgi:hypothetical protein
VFPQFFSNFIFVPFLQKKLAITVDFSGIKTALRQRSTFNNSGFNQLACQPQAQVSSSSI